jgi:hypothetical protein
VTIEHVVPGTGRAIVGDERSPGSSRRDIGAVAKQVVNQHRASINIVVGGGGAVDDHRATDTITELRQGVGVIPTATVLAHAEGVSASITWSESAFCNAWNTVLIVGAMLEDTVPMDLCSLALP